MTEQISFTKYERQVLPVLRENLNQAESTEDIKKFFSYALKELLQQIFAEQEMEFDYTDVVFDSAEEPFYTIDERLRTLDGFAATWENSDLPHIISNFAQAAKNRYTRLEKHFDKTEAKIRRQ
jgi:glycyl-tRNA synthetase beta subunit